ncbi:MAG: phospholipase D family protein [bacterium]|nr:phospholipase D family protein [bacterium]
MLQPTNRLTLINGMRPPAAFRLESAMAVTFTLNLQALLAAPAAFAIAGFGDRTDETGGQRPVELIHALRTNAHKLTVFSEAGAISLPPPSRAFAFLDQAVVPVTAPRGGIVHPKVWVLRYEASTDLDEIAKGDRRLRVLITSRNLTFDPSWDTVLRLDESAGPPGANLGAIGDLFEGLIENAVGAVATDHSERVRSLAEALRTAQFALPDGIDCLDVHVLGLKGRAYPLPTTADRSLIISPFLTDDFFSRLGPRPLAELVSRQSSLDGLSESTLEPIRRVWVLDSMLDDASISDTGDTPDEPGRPGLSPDDPGQHLVGLHAKVFAFEQDGRARLFVGSANATGVAFNNNVEVLAELHGPVSQLGIERLCEGNGDEPGLSDLFRCYKHGNGPNGPNGNGCLELDRARRAIARLPIKGSVERTDEECEEWAVTYRSAKPLPDTDTEIHCWPLTTPGNRRQVKPAKRLDVRFETSIEHISGLLAVELSHECGAQTGFVVPVPLEGLPENRDKRVLIALLGNAERFMRYLLAILYEGSTQIDTGTLIQTIDSGASGASSAGGVAVLERLMRTMRRDPSKLLALHPLVADLKTDKALPEGFAALWEAIYEMAVQEAGRQ